MPAKDVWHEGIILVTYVRDSMMQNAPSVLVMLACIRLFANTMLEFATF